MIRINLIYLLSTFITMSSSYAQGENAFSNQVGLELTSFTEYFPGIRAVYQRNITAKDIIDVDFKIVDDGLRIDLLGRESIKIGGYQSSLSYKRRLFRSFYLGAGPTYSLRTLKDDVILRRLDGIFFEEVDFTQKQIYYGGILSAGVLIPIGENVMLDLEFQYSIGKTIYKKIIEIPPGSEIEPNQSLEDRIRYAFSIDIQENQNGSGFDIAVLFTF